MRSGTWITAGIVVAVLGLAAVPFSYPLSPRTDPAPIQGFSAGAGGEPDVILVDKPGRHALWELGTTGDKRCRISTRSGSGIRVDEPRLTVRWESHTYDSDHVYTQIGAFDAPAAGAYVISCTTDDTPGEAFAVTRAPDTRLSLAALVAGPVAVVLGMATVVVAVVRRRGNLGRN